MLDSGISLIMSNNQSARKRKQRPRRPRTSPSRNSISSDVGSIADENELLNERLDENYNPNSNGCQQWHRASGEDTAQCQQFVTKPTSFSEEERIRRVSLSARGDEEETFVKEIRGDSLGEVNYTSARGNRVDRNLPALNISPSSASTPGIGRSPTYREHPSPERYAVQDNSNSVNAFLLSTLEHQRKLIENQRRFIDIFSQNKVLTKTTSQILPSHSVVNINDPLTPTARVCPIVGNENGGSQARLRTTGTAVRDENPFFIYERRATARNQRLSRSCDDILDEDERDILLPRPLERMAETRECPTYEDVQARNNFANGGCLVNRLGEVDGGFSNRPNGAGQELNDTREVDNVNNNDGGNFYRHASVSIDDSVSKTASKKCTPLRKNIRKLFYIMMVVNTLIVLSVVVFVSTRKSEAGGPICINCDAFTEDDPKLFHRVDGKCCVQSMQRMVEFFANKTRNKGEVVGSEVRPMVQYAAMGTEKIGTTSRIAWEISGVPPIHKSFINPGHGSTSIRIPVAGMYYIYSNICFERKEKTPQMELKYSFIHARGDTTLKTTKETTFSLRHNSWMNFVQNFSQHDEFYVILHNDTYWTKRQTQLGLFLL